MYTKKKRKSTNIRLYTFSDSEIVYHMYQSKRNIWNRNVNSIIFHETLKEYRSTNRTKECSTLNRVLVGLDLWFISKNPFIPSKIIQNFANFLGKKIHWTKLAKRLNQRDVIKRIRYFLGEKVSHLFPLFLN